MAKLILLRHGESMWNKKNLFTGWVDVPLSQKGIDEAMRAGQKIQDLPIDIVFSSTLVRGLMTAMLAMVHHSSQKTPVVIHPSGKLKEWGAIYSDAIQQQIIPVYSASELNERMYGQLQGLNKDEMRKKFGPEQVQIWRRSYSERPPDGESLEMTAKRAIPYFQQHIVPHLKQGKNVLVSAHGNSLRAIIKNIDGLTDSEVVQLELATGVPIVYDYVRGAYSDKKILT
jgi:2,3-bisphosphoglycerate-dependent phosphoglycerate mutase